MQDILLEMKNISKEFPSVKALDNVSLSVRRGTVHALMGENGAPLQESDQKLAQTVANFLGKQLES